MMWRMAQFSGVEIFTDVVMDNHFHILLKVPAKAKSLTRFDAHAGEPAQAGEERLLIHLATVYSKAFLKQFCNELKSFREQGMEWIWRSHGRKQADQLVYHGGRNRRRGFCERSDFPIPGHDGEEERKESAIYLGKRRGSLCDEGIRRNPSPQKKQKTTSSKILRQVLRRPSCSAGRRYNPLLSIGSSTTLFSYRNRDRPGGHCPPLESLQKQQLRSSW